MLKKSLLCLLVLITVTLPWSAAAAPLQRLDGFVVNASGTVDITGEAVRTVAVQPWDGKIVIGGKFVATAVGTATTRTNLARLNPDGTLDADFPEVPVGEVFALLPDPGTKTVYVGGSFTSLSRDGATFARRFLARIGDDGTTDSFEPLQGAADGGKVNALAMGATSLFAGGLFKDAGGSYENLVEISLPAGGVTGYAGVAADADDEVLSLLVQRDGRLVVGGTFAQHLLRFSAGAADATLTIVPNGAVRALAERADGSIVIAGDFTDLGAATPRGHLARIAPDGTPDPFDPGLNGSVASMILQPDGSIVAAGSFTAAGAAPRNYAARWRGSDTLDDAFHPDCDAPAAALVLDTSSKIIVGGAFGNAGGRPRSMLARFYGNGVLDDDASLTLALDDLSWYKPDIRAVAFRPDGKVAVAGVFPSWTQDIWQEDQRLPLLDTQWREERTYIVDDQVNSLMLTPGPRPDEWNLTVDSAMWFVDADYQYYLMRLDNTWERDQTVYSNGKTFDQNINDWMKAWRFNIRSPIARIPKDFASADHTRPGDPTSEEMTYVTINELPNQRTATVARVKDSGLKDESFVPPVFHTETMLGGSGYGMYAMAVQPDDKVVVAGELPGVQTDPQVDNYIMRLLPDGRKDPDFHPPHLTSLIFSVALQKDGGILVGGSFTDGEKTYQLMRLFDDGRVDTDFIPPAFTRSDGGWPAVHSIALQADGRILVSGAFHEVGGVPHTFVARLHPDGTLDPTFDTGDITLDGALFTGYATMVRGMEAQADGKVAIFGNFDAIDANPARRYLARLSNGFAGERLTVVQQAGGAKVSWERYGTAPEVWGVIFEDSPDGKEWTFLGRARSVAGGWELSGLPLAKGEVRYLRARGYAVNGTESVSGTPVLSVRQYYLDPVVGKTPLTVNLPSRSREYGEANPTEVTYAECTVSGALAPGDVISSVRVTSTAGQNSAAGLSFPLEADGAAAALFTSGSADDYEITYVPGTLTVTKREAVATAEANGKDYGSPDPPLLAHGTRFLDADLGAGKITFSATRAPGPNAGTYTITPHVADAGSGLLANYSVTPATALFTIRKIPQCITFPAIGDRTFGDAPFTISAVSCSGLPIRFSSSDTDVATVTPEGVVTIVGAGDALITASDDDGNGNYDPATPVVRRMVVYPSGQQITFTSVAPHVLGDPPFALSATASSGLPISYASSNTQVATVAGNVVTIVGVGTSVITASQEGSGNYTRATAVSQPLTVVLEGTPPLLAVSSLSSGAVTANPVYNLQGTCADRSGVARVTVNGVALAERDAFSIGIPLAVGSNTISVTAEDALGNSTTDSRSVFLDAAAPAVSIAAPADNGVADSFLLAVSGNSAEASALSVRVNGGATQSLGTVQGSFSATVALAAGINTVEVSATARGRTATVKRSVSFAPGYPAVSVTVPGQDLRSEEAAYTVRGSASGASAVSVQLEVNGASYAPAVVAGSFQQEIALPAPGRYRLKVTARDASGKSSVAYRDIIRQERIVGDVDGDGVVDVKDALGLLRITVGLDPLTPQALAHGDVAPLVLGVPQPNGALDIGDVVVLLRRVVGLVDF